MLLLSMQMYKYRCKCKNEFFKFQTFEEYKNDAPPICPNCLSKNTERVFSNYKIKIKE